MIGTTDPFQAIATSLQSTLMAQFPQLKLVEAAWPDTKWITTDGNKPGLFVYQVSEAGKAERSRIQPWASDSTYTYFETSRQQLLLQLTLVSSTPDERASLGYQIKQYLINLLQLPLLDGQMSLIRYRGDVSPKGETNQYMRHLTFQFQARVLEPVQGYPATNLTLRNNIVP